MDQLPELAPTHLAVPVFIVVMLLELVVGRVYGVAKFEIRDTGLNLFTSFVAGTERVLSGVLYAFVLLYFSIGYSILSLAGCSWRSFLLQMI